MKFRYKAFLLPLYLKPIQQLRQYQHNEIFMLSSPREPLYALNPCVCSNQYGRTQGIHTAVAAYSFCRRSYLRGKRFASYP